MNWQTTPRRRFPVLRGPHHGDTVSYPAHLTPPHEIRYAVVQAVSAEHDRRDPDSPWQQARSEYAVYQFRKHVGSGTRAYVFDRIES